MEFEATKDKKTFYFDEQLVRYVKFVAEKSSTMDRTNGAGQTQGWVCISEFDINYEKVDHVHAWSDWAVTTEPTCTETGLTEGKKCSRCDEILLAQKEIPALGHDW